MRSLESCISLNFNPLLKVKFNWEVKTSGYAYMDCNVRVGKGKIRVAENKGGYLFYMDFDDIDISGHGCWGDTKNGYGKYNPKFVYGLDYVMGQMGMKYRDFIYSSYTSYIVQHKAIDTYLRFVIDKLDDDKEFVGKVDKMVEDAKEYARKRIKDDSEKKKLSIKIAENLIDDVMNKYKVMGVPILEITRNMNFYTYSPESNTKYYKNLVCGEVSANDIVKSIRNYSRESIRNSFFYNTCKVKDSDGVSFSFYSEVVSR